MILTSEAGRDLNVIKSDCGVSVTYGSRAEQPGFDPQTGTAAETFTSVALVAVRGQHTQYEILQSDGRLKDGDQYFLIKVSDLGAVVPKMTDKITYGGVVYLVFGIALSSDELVYKVSVR